MITNLPDAAALDSTAIKLYFRAWNDLVSIVADYDSHTGEDTSRWLSVKSESKKEEGVDNEDGYSDALDDYINGAQDDLHAILSIVQQSNEIALKARIAKVSPYLLLLNSEIPFKTKEDVDFAQLRTLDAVDLPNAVSAFTDRPVTDAFITHYNRLRVIRNRYAHLGDTTSQLHPITVSRWMTFQYLELWPDRLWFYHRQHTILHGRTGFFDGKHWSPLLDAMTSYPLDTILMDAETFTKLVGAKRSLVKFRCFSCHDDWAVSRNLYAREIPYTAFYDNSRKMMHCIFCNDDFEVLRLDCDCGGPFAAPDFAEVGKGQCFTCGEGPD